MQFFDATEGTPERIGKTIGTILAALMYLGVIVLMLGVIVR
jgi:hypothetical protein